MNLLFVVPDKEKDLGNLEFGGPEQASREDKKACRAAGSCCPAAVQAVFGCTACGRYRSRDPGAGGRKTF